MQCELQVISGTQQGNTVLIWCQKFNFHCSFVVVSFLQMLWWYWWIVGTEVVGLF